MQTALITAEQSHVLFAAAAEEPYPGVLSHATSVPMDKPQSSGTAAEATVVDLIIGQSRSMAEAASLVESFLAGRKPTTLNTYRQGLEDFREFIGGADLNEAASLLLGNGHGRANGIALAYRANMLERKLSAATVNNRLSALRSLVQLARTLGMIPWSLEVANVKSEPYRDTKGPGRSAFDRIVHELDGRLTKKSTRDKAAVRLLHDIALRRAEVVGLDLQDVDLDAGTIAVVRKGRTQKVTLSMPGPTQTAVAAWLNVRGSEPGPLFVNFDRSKKGCRLTGTSLYRIVRALGSKVGTRTRPHGLRHTAITTACERAAAAGIGLEEVLDFSGHADVKTLMVYRDRNRNMQGKLAAMVAGEA